jgi:hypothetical protein
MLLYQCSVHIFRHVIALEEPMKIIVLISFLLQPPRTPRKITATVRTSRRGKRSLASYVEHETVKCVCF